MYCCGQCQLQNVLHTAPLKKIPNYAFNYTNAFPAMTSQKVFYSKIQLKMVEFPDIWKYQEIYILFCFDVILELAIKDLGVDQLVLQCVSTLFSSTRNRFRWDFQYLVLIYTLSQYCNQGWAVIIQVFQIHI